MCCVLWCCPSATEPSAGCNCSDPLHMRSFVQARLSAGHGDCRQEPVLQYRVRLPISRRRAAARLVKPAHAAYIALPTRDLAKHPAVKFNKLAVPLERVEPAQPPHMPFVSSRGFSVFFTVVICDVIAVRCVGCDALRFIRHVTLSKITCQLLIGRISLAVCSTSTNQIECGIQAKWV